MQTGAVKSGQRVLIYGPGGIGKSTLAAMLAQVGQRPLFFDVEGSTNAMDVARVPGLDTFQDLRDALHTPSLGEGFGAYVVDSLTRTEELGVPHVLSTVMHEKTGNPVKNIEGYGYGKGYVHIGSAMSELLGDLDAIARTGKTVVCICHDEASKVPNPDGEDFLRWEPRLQEKNDARTKVRNRFVEWADHVLAVLWDIYSEDGKATGGTTRTIYAQQAATYRAKSRTLPEPTYPFDHAADASIWQALFGAAS